MEEGKQRIRKEKFYFLCCFSFLLWNFAFVGKGESRGEYEDSISYQETRCFVTDWYLTEEEVPKAQERYREGEDEGEFVLLSEELVSYVQEGENSSVWETRDFFALWDTIEIPREIKREDGVLLRLEKVTKLQEYWKEAVTLSFTFLDYEAPFYMLEGQLLPHNDERPELDGMEELLLQREGYASPEFRVKELRWKGGTFLDVEFGLCREAELIAERQVADYRAVYRGERKGEEVIWKRRESVYGRVEESKESADEIQDERDNENIESEILQEETLQNLLAEEELPTKEAKEEGGSVREPWLLLRRERKALGMGILVLLSLGGGFWYICKKT
ncbi:MAG: hypothetical protein Q4D90_02290 [bacterium]|nr:hypothetical protein [bacterium]